MNDLYVYDPLTMTWTDLSSSTDGNPPTPRILHGFEVFDDAIYVQGGIDSTGDFLAVYSRTFRIT